jgi:beta-lactamase class A
MKLPILIAYLKQGEANPQLLNTPLLYEQQLDAPKFPHSNEVDSIEPGRTYTILELLEAMISNSDNEATLLLMSQLSQSSIDKVYKDFSVPFQPIVNSYEPFITASQYASFFRILYNATYVNQDFSELGLRILSNSSFTEGIRKKIPSEITIASKFGVYEVDEETNFHECGIIYTDNPFLLCIMTKGTDYKSQEAVIAEISRLVFEGLQEDY